MAFAISHYESDETGFTSDETERVNLENRDLEAVGSRWRCGQSCRRAS